MARKTRRRVTKPAADPRTPPAPAAVRWRAIDLVAIAAVLACVALGYLTRYALNPDGVSYLDLAAAVQRGDWHLFVQGYWSPLLPLITGILGTLTGRSGAELIPLAHTLSIIAAPGAVAIIWWWARRDASPVFGLAAIAALLLCSYGPPRFDVLTPDILLLFCMTWLGYELLAHAGRRWPIVGVLLGVSFLVKTSAWPWLLLAVPLRLWAAPDGAARRRVTWSSAVCAALMALWVVPLSREAGRPTLGSSGRLNFAWYLRGDLSQLPDIDPGRNDSYREIPVASGDTLSLAIFDDVPWTYQPWGDPTAWAAKVRSNTARTPAPDLVLGYWLRNAAITLGKWLLPMIIAALVPAFVVQRRAGMWRELLHEHRDALLVITLGAAGVAEFIAVHPEPRLVAPFAALLSLGVLHWCCAGETDRPMAPGLKTVLSWVGVIAAVGYALSFVPPNIGPNREQEHQVIRLVQLRQLLRASGVEPRIAVVGAAAPLMSTLYQAGARISAQVLPRSGTALAALSGAQLRAVLDSALQGKATQIWVASENGVRMWPVP